MSRAHLRRANRSVFAEAVNATPSPIGSAVAFVPPAWTEGALCAQVGGDQWMPEHGSGIEVSEAKAICNGAGGQPACPVRDECLAYALANDERWGVWGGKGPAERRRMKKRAAS